MKTGQEFNIVLRRIGKRLRRTKPPPPPPPPPPKLARARRAAGGHIELPEPGAPAPKAPAEIGRAVVAEAPAYERYIVGSFQVKIPVSTREAMLPAEETTLAILKGTAGGDAQDRPLVSRAPALHRPDRRTSGRLGRRRRRHPPSLGGYRPARRPCEENLEEFIGKVSEVVFNCFGDFIGFVMDDCCEHRAFESREKEIGELVLRALKERLTLMVVTVGKKHTIVRPVVKG